MDIIMKKPVMCYRQVFLSQLNKGDKFKTYHGKHVYMVLRLHVDGTDEYEVVRLYDGTILRMRSNAVILAITNDKIVISDSDDECIDNLPQGSIFRNIHNHRIRGSILDPVRDDNYYMVCVDTTKNSVTGFIPVLCLEDNRVYRCPVHIRVARVCNVLLQIE